MNAPALLEALSAAGVTVALNAAGDGLALSGRGQPPAALLEEVRASKAALLAALRGTQNVRTPELPHALPRRSGEAMPHPPSLSPSPLPDLAALALLPGHCGSCARFTPGPFPPLGLCSAGRRAHGWLDGSPLLPVEIHAAHGCPVLEGKGWGAP